MNFLKLKRNKKPLTPNKMQDQFMRIAMAQLRPAYPFRPQRNAVAAKMWVRFLERKAMAQWYKDQEANL
jgi:hypothetical protein